MKTVVEVRRVSDRVMTVVVFEDVLRLICGYVPLERFGGEKQSFYDELKGWCDIHSAGDLLMCLGSFNGHVDGHIDGFDLGYGIDQINVKGR